jgi:hypothetical protein
VLRELFNWLDHHPALYWSVAFAVTAGAGAIFWRQARRAAETRGQLVLEAALWAAFLLAWRWPWLLCALELNPDESQLIAGAIALTHDPVFWRSVDGTTSGPLNYYALLPVHWLGLPLDFFFARIVGLIFVWIGLVALQRALRTTADRLPAGIATLAAAVFFATTTEGDFLHYSSEHPSLALLPLSVWLIGRAGTAGSAATRSLLAGAFVAGLLPWSKLQTAPLGAVLVLWAAATAWRLRRGPLLVLLAGGAPSVLIAALAAGTGQWSEMWQRYLLHNVTYVADSQPPLVAWSSLAHRAGQEGTILWLLAAAIVAGLSAAWRGRRGPGAAGAHLAWALALIGAAGVAVAVPKRDFLHYLLLLVFPLAWGAGVAWSRALAGLTPRARAAHLLGALLLVAVLPLAVRAGRGTPGMFGQFADHWRRPAFADGAVLRAVARPGDAMAVWGWSPRTHVESRVPQATREPHTTWLILPNPRRDPFREVYLRDFRQRRPTFFLDATGPGAFFFTNRSRSAHELFPALAAEVARDYVLLYDFVFSRLYVRRDRLATLAVTSEQITAIAARARQPEFVDITPPDFAEGDVQRKVVFTREVLAAHAPARLEWHLPPDARSIELGYGFEPRAITEGQSDGVDVSLDLLANGESRRLFFGHYDPAQLPSDQRLQQTRIVLPAATRPGTIARVVVHPGPTGNNAWDWLYFARASVTTGTDFLPEQFPGFSHVPQRADIAHSEILSDAHGPLLMLHAPAQLEFKLTGQQHTLEWSFGLLPGAYTAGGGSDGVEFIATLVTAAGRTELFRQLVDPARREADRTEQTGRVPLPPHRAGDQLVLTLSPGPAQSPAWDWSYVRRFELR